MNVFLAHSIHDSDNAISSMQQELTALFRAEGIEDAIDVIPGRDDFKEHFASAGGWRGWPVDVATRRQYLTHGYFYDAFVTPHEYVGKATAQIIEYALDNSRPVLFLRDETLFVVTSLECVDAQDAKAGWKVRTNVLD